MADLDKVLKGLECCQNGFVCGEGCPYREVCFNGEYAFTHLAKDALELLKSQQAEIERLKEKDRLHCEDCAYNGICETPHTDKSPLCAEYSIVR